MSETHQPTGGHRPAALLAVLLAVLLAWYGLPVLYRLLLAAGTWQITRAAGIMAYLCLWLAAVTGLLLSGRLLGRAAPPALLAHVHQWAAAWSLYATAVHMVILLFDDWQPFRWTELLMPFAAAHQPVATALGVYALYAVLGVQVSSYLRAHLGTGAWRLTHYLSIPAYALALTHAVVIGTDTPAPWVQALYWSTGTLFAFLLVARLLALPRAAGAAAGHARR